MKKIGVIEQYRRVGSLPRAVEWFVAPASREAPGSDGILIPGDYVRLFVPKGEQDDYENLQCVRQ